MVIVQYVMSRVVILESITEWEYLSAETLLFTIIIFQFQSVIN